MRKNLPLVILLALAFVVSSNYTYSQLTYTAANATNTAGTYTDLGTNGTVITTANFDDANSAPVDIGFSFNYGCSGPFTQFILNTNGFIKMGTAPPSAANLFFTESNSTIGGVMNSTDTADRNIISVFNHDLAGAAGAEYRVYTSGTTPSRVTTIQFKNLVDSSSSSTERPPGNPIPDVQYSSIQFQIKLYEGSNKIEFVYGTWTSSGNTAIYKTAAVGLKTTSPAVTATKFSGAAWSATTFLNGNYVQDSHNHRNEFLPDAGRKYTFTPTSVTLVNDIAVTDIYTLGDLPVGITPQPIVSVRLENKNVCNDAEININLDITGAQAYNVTEAITIPAGSTMIHGFSGYNPTVEGVNYITVSIPADSDNNNNTMTYRQAATPNILNYFDTTDATNFIGFNGGPGGLLLVKYTITENRTVTAVNVFIGGTTTENKTLKAVVVNSNGEIIGTSSNFVPTSADLDKYHTLAITSPPAIGSGNSFYVGLAQTGSAYFPLGTQEETNARPGTYYTAPLAGGATIENATLGRFMIGAVLGPDDTGMDEVSTLDKSFSVYPNPSHGLINIQLEKEYASAVDITISDILGKTFYHNNNVNNSVIAINLSHLPEGIYFIQLTSKGQRNTKKIILTK